MAKMWLNTDKTKGTSHTFAFVLVGFANVRFGLKAEVTLFHRNVCSCPESRHWLYGRTQIGLHACCFTNTIPSRA